MRRGTAQDRRNWWRFTRLCCAFGLTWALVTYLISAGIVAVGDRLDGRTRRRDRAGPLVRPVDHDLRLRHRRLHRLPSPRTEMKNRIRVLRAERSWTQAQLAQRLEVSRQTVNAIETGRYDPGLPLAFRIAEVFGQSIEAIFTP